MALDLLVQGTVRVSELVLVLGWMQVVAVVEQDDPSVAAAELDDDDDDDGPWTVACGGGYHRHDSYS